MKSRNARCLQFLLTMLPAIGILVVSPARADHEGAITQFVNGFGAGDGLWSNPANWNNHGPPTSGPSEPLYAFINVSSAHPNGAPAVVDAVASAVDIYVGQGAGDGALRVTTGGDLTVTANLHVARDSGREGFFTMDGGTATIDTTSLGLAIGHQGSTAAAEISGGTLKVRNIRIAASDADSTASGNLTVSGGIVTTNVFNTGLLHLGHRGGNATMSITGGAVTNRDIRLSDVDATSTAVSSLDINGGFFTAQLMGIGTRHTVVDPVNGISTYGAGRGSVSIGSNAVVNLGQNMFLRPGSGNAVTINGSAASITAHRNGATGFEVHSDSAVNFNFDASGISTINLNGHANGSRLQFSWITNSEGVRPTGILNVDASNYPGSGTFYLFKFVNTIAGGVLGSGEFSQHNLTLASGSTGSVTYIRDQGVEGNGLVLTIVAAPSNAPELKVSRTDSGVEIRWETQSGFVLQSATSLDSPVNWENVSQTPVTEGNDSVVTLPANQAEAYFRLLK